MEPSFPRFFSFERAIFTLQEGGMNFSLLFWVALGVAILSMTGICGMISAILMQGQ
jgi:hypothetical protein